MRSIGVVLRFNEEVVSVERTAGQQVIVRLKSGKEIAASTVPLFGRPYWSQCHAQSAHHRPFRR